MSLTRIELILHGGGRSLISISLKVVRRETGASVTTPMNLRESSRRDGPEELYQLPQFKGVDK
jgi:hypothetical protein